VATRSMKLRIAVDWLSANLLPVPIRSRQCGTMDNGRTEVNGAGPDLYPDHSNLTQGRPHDGGGRIVAAAREIAETAKHQAICCFTQSRPPRRADSRANATGADHCADAIWSGPHGRLALTWGVNCVADLARGAVQDGFGQRCTVAR